MFYFSVTVTSECVALCLELVADLSNCLYGRKLTAVDRGQTNHVTIPSNPNSASTCILSFKFPASYGCDSYMYKNSRTKVSLFKSLEWNR